MNPLLVVDGCTLQATPGTVSGLGGMLLPKVKCSGKQVYNFISFNVTDGAFTGSGVLAATSIKVKITSLAAVRSDATADIVLSDGHGGTEPCHVIVLNAGQSKVRAA